MADVVVVVTVVVAAVFVPVVISRCRCCVWKYLVRFKMLCCDLRLLLLSLLVSIAVAVGTIVVSVDDPVVTWLLAVAVTVFSSPISVFLCDTGVVHLDPAIRRPHVRLLLEGRRLLRQGGRGSRCRGNPGRLTGGHHSVPQVRSWW